MLKRALRAGDARRHGHAGAARLRLQEQGRPAAARRGHRLPAEPARRAADARASTRAPSTSSRAAPALDEPFAALAFKVMSDPYVGKLTYFRVYSGQVKAGDRVLNTTTGKTERDRPHPPDAREPPRGARGDRRRRDRRRRRAQERRRPATRSPIETAPIRLESMDFPEPVISVAIEPKTKGDQDKLGAGPPAPRRGGSDLPRPHGRGDRADAHRRAWASCTSRSSSTA